MEHKGTNQTQVSPSSIKDLVNSTHGTPTGALKILRAIRQVLPLLDDGMEQTAIDVANKRLAENNPGFYDEDGAFEAETVTIHFILRELDHYSNKQVILDAAIAECEKVETKMKKLVELRPAVKQVFEALDDRTKAIFEIYDELMRLYGVSSKLDYSEYLDFFPPSVDALRDEPALAPALKAYDLASDINGIID